MEAGSMSDRPGILRLARMEQEGLVRRSPVRSIAGSVDAWLADESVPGVASEMSLTLPYGLPFSEWCAVGAKIGRRYRSLKWWIGDWLNYGERAYGEMYAQGMDSTGLDYAVLVQYAYVSRKFPPESRHESLSWSHHQAAAPLERYDAEVILDAAVANGWKREAVRAAVKLVQHPELGETIKPASTFSSSEPCQCHCHTGTGCDCGTSE
jgi:hypothetical protein